MAKDKVVNFVLPDGKIVTNKVITAYKVAGGEEYNIIDTEKFDENNNKIVGVSYKPNGEERFQNIVDMEEWKKAKGLLVDDLHDKKDTFEYRIPQEETLVTEDFMHNLALREENLNKLVANFEEYLKSKETTVEKAPEINPFAAQEIVSPQVAEEPQPIIPEISPAPIVDIAPEAPSIAPAPEMVQSAPIENNIVEFPSVENTGFVQEQNTIADTPSVAPIVEENNVVNMPQQEVQNDASSVESAYIENINALIEQMKTITNEFIKQMEHMKNVSIEEFKQIKELRQLAEDTVKKAENVMATANNNYNEEPQPVLAKVA